MQSEFSEWMRDTCYGEKFQSKIIRSVLTVLVEQEGPKYI